MPNPEQELERLTQRLEAVKRQTAAKTARLKELEQERRGVINRAIRRARYRLSAAERKRRTRRLILMGTYLEHVMHEDADTRDRVMARLDAFLDRDRDRELFGFTPKETPDG